MDDVEEDTGEAPPPPGGGRERAYAGRWSRNWPHQGPAGPTVIPEPCGVTTEAGRTGGFSAPVGCLCCALCGG